MARSKQGILLSPRKHVADILSEADMLRMLGYKVVDTPMGPNLKESSIKGSF